jgi:hypothetical protein
MNFYRKLLLLSILTLFTIFLSSQIIYAFDDGFFWFSGAYPIDWGTAGSGLTSGFTITNAGIVGNGPDTLSVTVQSNTAGATPIETINLVLDETADTGNFIVDHLVFMDQESEFAIGDTVLITIEDQCDEFGEPGPGQNGNCDPLMIETLFVGDSVKIFSDSTAPGFIGIDLIETGINTGIFTRQLTFCNSPCVSDPINAILEVSAGDVFTIEDQHTFAVTNGLISGDPKRFAIIVEGGGTVQATATTLPGSTVDEFTCTGYAGTWDAFTDTCTVTDIITMDFPPSWVGRGGGGLVRPGLVIDAILFLVGGGGSSGSMVPPTLGLDMNQKRIVDGGFSFNGNPVDVEQFYTPYPLITTPVGQNNTVKLKIYENRGPDNITHVGLSYGLGKGEIFNEGRATIEYDRTFDGIESVTIFDPKHVLGSVNVTTATTSCSILSNDICLEVTFDHIFRESLDYNMVATNIWDFQRNGYQNYFNHGIHIVGESMNPPEEYSGIYHGHIYHLTETGPNTATDDDGNTWTFDKIWNRDYIKPINVDSDILNPTKIYALEKLGFQYSDGKEIFGYDKMDHRFADIKYQQQIEAQNIMNSLCSKCQKEHFEEINDIFSYDMSTRYSKLDNPQIITQIDIEDQNARQLLKEFFEKIYPGKVND